MTTVATKNGKMNFVPNQTAANTATAVPGKAPAASIGGLMKAIGERTPQCFQVVFANGSRFRNREGNPVFTVRFRTAAAQRRAVLFGHVGLLESYFDGSVDVDGNIALAFRVAFDAGFDQNKNTLVGLRNAWHEFRFSNRSIRQAKANARFHYGLGQAFYRHWLDRELMMYTCGYWPEGTTTLEQAQRNKVDHVCRKVQLQAGETLVDIGSGFGGLLFHAWEHYGAKGTGINNTPEQVREVREEAARRGLAHVIDVIEADFREIPGEYDKLLSIGTLEHAGRDELFSVVAAHARALKRGGLGVIHFIGHVGVFDTNFYIRKHIFPGGWIPSLAEAIDAMERCGLEIVDVENLRRHYALTLDCWAQRFDDNWPAIQALDPRRFDETFRRKWRTYLWSCAEMFRSPNARTHLFQVTVSKGKLGAGYPMGRGFLYR
jgi:cyclopropane-fatty-acyl-phospholipid synthase